MIEAPGRSFSQASACLTGRQHLPFDSRYKAKCRDRPESPLHDPRATRSSTPAVPSVPVRIGIRTRPREASGVR
jgi:hypothetical protein